MGPRGLLIPLTTSSIDRGTLRAEFRAQAGTTAYRIGYEGDHASHVDIPVEPSLPPTGRDRHPHIRPYVEDGDLSFDGIATGGVAPYTYRWHFEGGGGRRSTAEDPTHAFPRPGDWTVTLAVKDTAHNRATAEVTLSILQRDFVDAPRAVIAVIDTGVNPYHPTYKRAGAQMSLAAFADATNGNATAQVLDLAETGTYAQRISIDEATWDSIDVGELVHFNNTNVFGVSFHDPAQASAIGTQRIRDVDGHGTATTSTALAKFDARSVYACRGGRPYFLARMGITSSGMGGSTFPGRRKSRSRRPALA